MFTDHWILSGTTGEPVPEETFTHSHLSQPLVIPYLLHPPIMIHSILPVQFTCLTVFFHNRSPSFLWSTSGHGTLHFILHTFLHQSLSSFHSTCPHHHKLSCCSHLCPLKCHLIFLSYGPGLTSMQHTTLHTTAVQSPSH